jgi:FAD/FMN-containing dehydrogenase
MHWSPGANLTLCKFPFVQLSFPFLGMTFFVFFLCVLSTALQYALAKTAQQIEKDLTASLSARSEVVLTSDSAFTEDFTQRWTIYGPANPGYSIAAKPATIQDLQTIVKYAVENNVSILATGGGHGYSTILSGVQQVLDVDLGNFKNVSVDASANTMTVGGSAIFADIYDPLYNAGKQFRKFERDLTLLLKLMQDSATGGSSSPGILGVTLGGGIGPLTGAHGLLIDSLLSVEMLSGTGDILTGQHLRIPTSFGVFEGLV